MDIRRLLVIARKWLPLVLASVVLAAGASFALSSLQQKTYEARATLIVGQSLTSASPDYTQLLVSQQLSTTYAKVATTRPILEAVITKLKLDTTTDELLTKVHADSSTGSTLLTISAQATDPDRAAAIANAVAEQLVTASAAIEGRQADLQASVDADLAATQAQIAETQDRVTTLTNLAERTPAQETELATLEGRLVSLRSTYATLLSFSSASLTNLLTIVEPAAPLGDPISPRPLLNTRVAAVLGLLIAAGIAFAAEYFTDAVGTSDDLETAVGLTALGTIARMRSAEGRGEMYRLATLLYPRSSTSESYRTLRANLEFTSLDTPLKSLLVTSTRASEGKTITSSNLAVVFAQTGRRVLLVDADLRKPGIHLVFNLLNTKGLTTLLRDDGIQFDQIAQATEQENLMVLTTGPLPPNPAELLGSHRMRVFLEHAESAVDLVIIDSPPLQAFADGAILGSLVDGTVLVIDARRSRRRAVRLGREVLARAGSNVLGAVLNRVSERAYVDEYGGYFSSEQAQATPGQEESPGPAAP
jgi:tyrosine-protein kinase